MESKQIDSEFWIRINQKNQKHWIFFLKKFSRYISKLFSLLFNTIAIKCIFLSTWKKINLSRFEAGVKQLASICRPLPNLSTNSNINSVRQIDKLIEVHYLKISAWF